MSTVDLGLALFLALAAALSISLSVAGGASFPGRDLIIFLAGTTIVATLCINVFTLPLVLRLLDLPQDGAAEREERLARKALESVDAAGFELRRRALTVEHARLRSRRDAGGHQRHAAADDRIRDRPRAELGRRPCRRRAMNASVRTWLQ